ncbi:hypothetical protein UlMin_030633 [Ulmus minor]
MRSTKLSLLAITSLIGLFLTSQAFPAKNRQLISEQQDFVAAHNVARKAVGVGLINWNDTVAAYAQNYAERRMNDCDMEHSEGPYGENLMEGWDEVSGGDATRFWVSEKPHNDYASNQCVGDECGHYTQVVWRKSIHLGCARAKCRNGWMFVICNYDPPGNYEGERPY